MAEPRNTGNKAEEIAEAECGVDFGSVNRSGEPTQADDIPVDVQRHGSHLIVSRTDRPSEDFRRDVGDFRDSAQDLLRAQIFDDPTMIAPSAERDLARRKSERGSLIFFAITPSFAAAPADDRVLIQRTTMETAYSCTNCKGHGHTDDLCKTCNGAKVEIFHQETVDFEAPCRSCQVLGYSYEVKHPCGHAICQACRGAGWAGGVVIPEISQSEPCWGVVVSCGPKCVNYFPGELVQYSRYAGHTNTTKNGESFTTMHEHEILWHLAELKKP